MVGKPWTPSTFTPSATSTRRTSSTTASSRSSTSARTTSGSSSASASASARTVLPLDYIRTTRNADVRAGQEAALYSNVETAQARGDHGARARRACSDGHRHGRRRRLLPRDGHPLRGVPDRRGPRHRGAGDRHQQRVLELRRADAPARVDAGPSAVRPRRQPREHDARRRLRRPRHVRALGRRHERGDRLAAGPGARSRRRDHARLVAAGGSAQSRIPRFGHFAQEGTAVQRFAIKTTLACLEAMLPAARARLAESAAERCTSSVIRPTCSSSRRSRAARTH